MKSMKSIYRKADIGINKLLSYVFVIWVLNPMTHNYCNPQYLMLIVTLWFITAYLEGDMAMGRAICNSTFAISCIYPLVLIVYAVFGHTQFEKSSLEVPLIVIFYMYCHYRQNTEMNRSICRISITYIVLMIIYTLIKLQDNPYISRLLASGNVQSNIGLVSPFTAGYTEVYYLVFLSATIWGIIFFTNKVKVKKTYILLLGLLLIFFIKAQYTIAVLLFCGAVLLIQFTKGSRRIFLLAEVLLLCILFFIVWENGFSGIIYFLADLVPAGILRNRVIQIGDLFSSNRPLLFGHNGAIVRFNLYLTSWNTFIKYFFFGIGNRKSIESAYSIGGHSTFLDRLGEQGLFGGGIYIATRIFILIKISRTIPKQWRRIYYIIIATYIVMSILNTTNRNSILLMLIVVVPLLLEDADRYMVTQKKNEISQRIFK